jgi:hypothetical protein
VYGTGCWYVLPNRTGGKLEEAESSF